MNLDLIAFFKKQFTCNKRWSINHDDKDSKGTHWVSLCIDRNTAVYFDSFGIEYIPQEVLNKIKDKSITHNIFRIQGKESIKTYWL